MQKRLEDLETWKGEIHLPEGAENLVVLSKASLLVEQLDELEQITREQMSLLEVPEESSVPTGFASSVLQQIHDTIAMLRQMLYEVQRV
ncbi:hypothetical protein GOODEAATRI_006717 [Goodea atripinnis]|uniref:Uncharacterized protein n=1 Tax=Goodea atripinnis TaxID=208336 RepID=A0ABV0MSU9_9TELE